MEFEKFSGDSLGNIEELNDPAKEEMLVRLACNNSYMILIEQATFKEILDATMQNQSLVAFAHDPEKGFNKSDLESMLEFFEVEEDYEKCAVIRDKINLKDY